MSKFKKGQKVWSLKYGPGLVVAIESPAQDDYPVTVSFKSVSGFIRQEAYMMNGKLYAPDYTPDLYVKKPVILSKQRLNYLTLKNIRQMLYIPLSKINFIYTPVGEKIEEGQNTVKFTFEMPKEE